MAATHLIHTLTERVNNGRLAYVFGSLVHCGAKTELKYLNLIVCARFKIKEGTTN